MSWYSTVATGEVRGNRQAVQIIGLERCRAIGTLESVIGISPRATLVTLAPVFEIVHPFVVCHGAKLIRRFVAETTHPTGRHE